jgi:hypothetical protein
MPEALVPQLGCSNAGEDTRGGEFGPHHWVEITVGITSENHHPGSKVLNRKATRVKFNRNGIVTAKLSNREQIFDKRRRNENIAKRNRGCASDQ